MSSRYAATATIPSPAFRSVVPLATQGVAEAEVGQLHLRGGEVARPGAIRNELAVRCDGHHSLACILAQIGLFKTEQKVVGIFMLECAHDADCFLILRLAAQEEGNHGSRFYGCADAVVSGISQHGQACGLRPCDPGKADEEFEGPG